MSVFVGGISKCAPQLSNAEPVIVAGKPAPESSALLSFNRRCVHAVDLRGRVWCGCTTPRPGLVFSALLPLGQQIDAASKLFFTDDFDLRTCRRVRAVGAIRTAGNTQA